MAKRLKAVSDRSGIAVAQLVRIATEEYLEKVRGSGKIEIDVTPVTPGRYAGETGAAADIISPASSERLSSAQDLVRRGAEKPLRKKTGTS